MVSSRQPQTVYRQRGVRFARDRDRASARARRVSLARLGFFAAALGALLVPLPPGSTVLALRLLVAGALFLGFLASVIRHDRIRRQVAWYDTLRALNEEGRSRIARDWDALPEVQTTATDEPHPFAADLNVFGHASLYRLIGPASTLPGRQAMRAWLLGARAWDGVRERQAAVRELAPRIDLRQQLAARGRTVPDVHPERLRAFLGWAEAGPWLASRPILIWSSRALPVLALTLIVLNALGVVPWTAWALVLVGNLTLGSVHFRLGRQLDGHLERASGVATALAGFIEVFELLADVPFDSETLRDLQARLGANDDAAATGLRRLRRIMDLTNIRRSMLAPVFQALLLWDFHMLLRLERWRGRTGPHVRGWLDALGELEVLAALARLGHDHPAWAYPRIVTGEPVLRASGLGHPLLADDERVPNDVRLGPPGTFLLVTGSNMSGKSTLLRSIGANVLLARAGGPVCAAEMELAPVRVYTVMQVRDSLERGLSHYMAELRRLKAVVDAAERDGPTLLYLLDDILQGTNSVERQLAARRVIQRLLRLDAIGAVTTHDLALAEPPRLAAAARPVHFSETVRAGASGPEISFDYELRPGVAGSRNALRLLELVGLDRADREGVDR